MEGKAHSKHTYNVTGQVSRMEQDLLNCSENFQASFKLRTPTRMGSTLDGEKGARPHVCIVGAGLAGLRCAQVLIEQDVRVTIIEARDRLGGRVSLGGREERNRHTKTEIHYRFARPISRVMKWICEEEDVRLKSCPYSDRSKGPELDPWYGFESGSAARQGHKLCTFFG